MDDAHEFVRRWDPLLEPDAGARRLWRGRWTLRIYIIAVLVVSASTITAMAVYVGPQRLPQGVGRFCLTCVLMAYLWRGSQVARWLTVVLMGSAGLFATVLVLSSNAPTVFAFILALMNSTYLPLAVALAVPSPVRDFVLYQNMIQAMEKTAARVVKNAGG